MLTRTGLEGHIETIWRRMMKKVYSPWLRSISGFSRFRLVYFFEVNQGAESK